MNPPHSSSPHTSPPIFRGILGAALLVSFSIALTLVGLEVGIRVMKLQKLFAMPVNVWSERWETTQRPRTHGFLVCPLYHMELDINSKGLRDREFAYAKPASTRRILVLGDSFTCGYGVEAEQTFSKELERLLNARPGGPHWEVLNAGVGSTGPTHHLAWYVDEGQRYDPDIVLLAFFPGNDFTDDRFSGLYTIEADRLVRHPAPRTAARRAQTLVQWIPGARYLFATSHLLNYVKYKVADMHRHSLDVAADARSEAEAAKGNPVDEESLTRRVLVELRDQCRARGSRLVLAVVPTEYTGQPSRELAGFLGFLMDQGIPCLDLSPSFGPDAGLTHYAGEGHWNVRGHELAAQRIQDFLARDSLLTEQTSATQKLRPQVRPIDGKIENQVSSP